MMSSVFVNPVINWVVRLHFVVFSFLAYVYTFTAPARKTYRIGFLFTHENRDLGSISVTTRSFNAPISKVERVTYRIGSVLLFGTVWAGIQSEAKRLVPVSVVAGHRIFFLCRHVVKVCGIVKTWPDSAFLGWILFDFKQIILIFLLTSY